MAEAGLQAQAGITAEEHAAIVARELNAERRDFYELLWHTGAAQTDAACLKAEDIDWDRRTICYTRKKLKSRGGNIKPALIRFSEEVAAILKRRPQTGPLFPYLRTVRPSDRATEFRQRCVGLEIKGVTLHSYRYAWAERALKSASPSASRSRLWDTTEGCSSRLRETSVDETSVARRLREAGSGEGRNGGVNIRD